MNKKSAEAKENFVDIIHLTRDSAGVPTGGKVVIRYTTDNKEVERFGYDASGQKTFHQTIVYNNSEAGLEKIVNTFGPDGSHLQTSISQFDLEGNLLETQSINSAGKIIDRQTYSYTSESVHYCHFDEAEQLIETWVRPLNQ